eukprot:gene13837-3225_t
MRRVDRSLLVDVVTHLSARTAVSVRRVGRAWRDAVEIYFTNNVLDPTGDPDDGGCGGV